MARKRIELTPGQQADIATRTSRGQSLDTISKALGLSRATVQRRQKELKDGGLIPAPALDPVEDAALGAEINPADLATIDKWIPKVERVAEDAQAAKDYAAFNAAMSRLVALLEHKRKATPIPKVDPNDNPDMVAAAEKFRKRFSNLLDLEA